MNPAAETELPDLLRFADGSRVNSAAAWPQRREEVAALILDIEYGGLPPAPSSCHAELLHESTVRHTDGVRFTTWRVQAGPDPRFSFLMTTYVPKGNGPFPVVLTGDACWRYATEAIVSRIVSNGSIFAQFNRVELAPDTRSPERTSGLYTACPGGSYGALSAWAWGYHRCVDALVQMKTVNPAQIAITGHSRGGKTVLLAGATDPRIALVAANGSGAGGAGSYLKQGPRSETLADCLRFFPYWYGPRLKEYLGRESALPFDQHFLKALMAPRALLATEALGDLWANPSGTWHTHLAACEVYRLLEADNKLGIHFRDGEHDHSPLDWEVFLDFMNWHFRGTPPAHTFDRPPPA